jgi:hypothetical protein
MSHLLELLDYLIGLIIREVGVNAARQTIVDRIEIAAGRAAADAEATERFGEVPKP